MAMENHISLEDFSAVNSSVNSNGDGSVMLDNDKESGYPENAVLEDLDSYLEDIDDCLTISRMVSDSVIKGMVNAVEHEAAEKISQKELELARLKETLHLYQMRSDENESSGSLVMQHEPGSAEHGPYSNFSDVPIDFDWIGESLGNLNKVAKEQLKNLRKEIDCIKGSSSIRRMGSGSEMVGLSGILQDKVSDVKWMDIDKTLDSLRTTLDTKFKQVDNYVCLSKTSLRQWQQEKEFQGEIEDMVIMNCFRSLKEEFEERLWDQNARFYGNESKNWLEKFKEISSLRQELDAISKSLIVPEIGQMISHGSEEIIEERDNNKKTDHLHRKVSGNHVSLSASHWEGNGKRDESVIAVPENLDFAQLKHMSKEDLVTYFKTEMTKMKRNHELEVHEMTEENFSLKREYLRERAFSLPFKRNKECDILRKKIPEVILKLDGILVENEKLLTFSENAESLRSWNDRFESLFSENRQLRGLLADKKREFKRISAQVSDNTEIMLQHSLAEANLVKRIGNLQSALEDAQVEASISLDVYKCFLKDMVDFSKSMNEQTNTEFKIMQEIYEIIFQEAAQNAEHTNKCDIEFESCLSENSQLRGLLADKKRAVTRISSQVSDNTEIMLQHSLAEANLVKRIRNLQCALEDAQVEASISLDVYKCFLKDVVDFSKSMNEQTDTEFKIMQEINEIIFREAAQNAEHTNKCDIEDSDLESIIMQGLCGVIFREALKESEEKLTELNGKYIKEKEIQASTEMEALQKECALRLEVAEKERLKQEMLEKEKIMKEAAAALVKQKEQSASVSQEINNLRDETSQQKQLISEFSKESNVLKGSLREAMQQIELDKVEVHELKQRLELATKELSEEKKMLLSVTQEKQNASSLFEAKESEHRKQMQSMLCNVHGLSKAFVDYEYRVMEDIKKSNLRLDNLSSQLAALIQKANIFRRTGLMYKQRLERRCSELQKAEAEVDLLGDEVDALSSLLEKIYIALDHYSPILQHYPGVIEILKLIRRELSGESTKAV